MSVSNNYSRREILVNIKLMRRHNWTKNKKG
jgi:hypothetical protein